MNITELYKSMLNTAGMKVTKDDYISVELFGETTPALIDNKRLVLPTNTQLNDPNWDKRIIFHPLSENIVKPMSSVLKYYNTAFQAKLNVVIPILGSALINLSHSTALHKQFTPEQSEFLSHVKNVDGKTIEWFNKLVKAVSRSEVTTDSLWANFYVKRGGIVKDKQYSRIAVVTFPAINKILTEDKPYGLTIPNKALLTIRSLLSYIYPNTLVEDYYNVGVNSTIAPFCEIVMNAIHSLITPINELVRLMGDLITEKDNILFDDAWVDMLISPNEDTLMRMIATIPHQNERPEKQVKPQQQTINTPVNNLPQQNISQMSNQMMPQQNMMSPPPQNGPVSISDSVNRTMYPQQNMMQQNQMYNNMGMNNQFNNGFNQNQNMSTSPVRQMYNNAPPVNNFGMNNQFNQFNNGMNMGNRPI